MGNHPSQSNGGSRSSSDGTTSASRMTFPTFHRTTGSLALSKLELEKRCRPSGLYPSCEWEDRAIRRLVGDGKLAARLRGTDSRCTPTDRECPICFLHYSQINITACCQATLCSECYLQICPQKEKVCSCPFCNNTKLVINVAKNLNVAQVAKREEEEQKVIEATIRARAYSAGSSHAETSHSDVSDSTSAGISATLQHDDSSPGSSPTGFGSSLERHSSTRLLRTRSESMSSDGSTLKSANSEIASLAMTPDERRALEDEMRAQHSHPLARQMQREAEQRRTQNDLHHYRQNSNRIASQRYNRDMLLLRAHGISPRGRMGAGNTAVDVTADNTREGRLSQRLQRLTSDSRLLSSTSSSTLSRERRSTDGSGRNWNQIVQAFEDGGNGEVSTLDDLVVIEAAILLSMEEEAARRRRQLRAAMRRPAGGERSNDEDDDDDDNEDGEEEEEELNVDSDHEDSDEEVEENSFSAAEHAGAGFPLLPHFFARRDDDGNNEGNENVARSLLSIRNRSRFRGIGNRSSSTGMFLRGISEDEQMALAIALSLREAETQRERDRERDHTSSISEDSEHGSADRQASSNVVGAVPDVAEVPSEQNRASSLLEENLVREEIVFEAGEEEEGDEQSGALVNNTLSADVVSADSSGHESPYPDDEELPASPSDIALASSSISSS